MLVGIVTSGQCRRQVTVEEIACLACLRSMSYGPRQRVRNRQLDNMVRGLARLGQAPASTASKCGRTLAKSDKVAAFNMLWSRVG